jgi:hypothetical protein
MHARCTLSMLGWGAYSYLPIAVASYSYTAHGTSLRNVNVGFWVYYYYS